MPLACTLTKPDGYAVECRADGASVAKATFEVVQNPPEVADGEVRVKAIRIFAVELEFSHAPLGREAKVPVDCWFFWPDGQTSPPLVLSYEPQPTWAGGYSAGAMGFAEPGGWAKGVYTVSCAIDGQPVAVERFDVTPPAPST